jgi:hypothetical protein
VADKPYNQTIETGAERFRSSFGFLPHIKPQKTRNLIVAGFLFVQKESLRSLDNLRNIKMFVRPKVC